MNPRMSQHVGGDMLTDDEEFKDAIASTLSVIETSHSTTVNSEFLYLKSIKQKDQKATIEPKTFHPETFFFSPKIKQT